MPCCVTGGHLPQMLTLGIGHCRQAPSARRAPRMFSKRSSESPHAAYSLQPLSDITGQCASSTAVVVSCGAVIWQAAVVTAGILLVPRPTAWHGVRSPCWDNQCIEISCQLACLFLGCCLRWTWVWAPAGVPTRVWGSSAHPAAGRRAHIQLWSSDAGSGIIW